MVKVTVERVVVEDHWRLTNQPLKALIPCKKASLSQEYWCKNETVMAKEFDKTALLHYYELCTIYR